MLKLMGKKIFTFLRLHFCLSKPVITHSYALIMMPLLKLFPIHNICELSNFDSGRSPNLNFGKNSQHTLARTHLTTHMVKCNQQAFRAPHATRSSLLIKSLWIAFHLLEIVNH